MKDLTLKGYFLWVMLCLIGLKNSNASSHNLFYLDRTDNIKTITIPAYDNSVLNSIYNSKENDDAYGFDIKTDQAFSDIQKDPATGKLVGKLKLKAPSAMGIRIRFSAAFFKGLTLKINDAQGRLLYQAKDADKKALTTDVFWNNDLTATVEADHEMAIKQSGLMLSTLTYVFHKPESYKTFFSSPPAPFCFDYKGVCLYDSRTLPHTAAGGSLTCFEDANCQSYSSAGCREIRSSVLLSVSALWEDSFDNNACSGAAIVSYFYSGVLVNNVRNDMTPYILTAAHAIDPAPVVARGCKLNGCSPCSLTTTVTKKYQGSWLIYYNYQRPVCDPDLGGNDKLFTEGVEVLYNGFRNPSCYSDIALLKVLDNPNSSYDIPVGYDVYFAGWNTTYPTSGTITSVSHPNKDVKKMYQSPVCTTCYSGGSYFSLLNAPGDPLQGGMSGSGVFDSDHRLRGITVSGGPQNNCVSATTLSATKLSYCWNYIKPYLDPDNTGATSIDGYDPLAECRTTVDVHGTLYPAATWRSQNQVVIHAGTDIIAPPANLTCSIEESPVYAGSIKQPYPANADYIFRAGQSVTLNPGFKVAFGNKFKAEIQACTTYTVCSSAGGYGKKAYRSPFVPRFDEENGVNDTGASDEIVLYPNPASRYVRIKFPEEIAAYKVDITDVGGKSAISVSYQVKPNASETTIDVSELNAGVYTCIVYGAKEKRIRLVIVK